jgi:acylphosphatase
LNKKGTKNVFRQEVDRKAKKLYTQTTKYLEDGRVEVHIPFKDYNINNTLNIAYMWLRQLEYKFTRNKEHERKYKDFIPRYIAEGKLELIKTYPFEKIDRRTAYFLHRGVFKGGSRSNPIRVVFNASATKENEKSCNQCTL